MDIFDVLKLLGGLCLFLFGMTLMGQALERRAGNKLKSLLGRMTSGKAAGLLTGLVITAIIQSSSATTVMVVGFVNSGLMTLRQSINVIMGANIGTTVTAWILSLTGIDGGSAFISLLKPSSFTPVLALIGIVFYMASKDSRRKDTGMILLAFAVLMTGMETMSGAVSGLRDIPEFRELFLAFSSPVLGVLAGLGITAVIQSSSASVGILQALASTGAVSYGAAVPIIMGQNIGTCVTALLSSIGTGKNARRAALVHLGFNVIGTTVWLTVFCIVKAVFSPVLLTMSAGFTGIALAHSVFNILCTLLMLPLSGTLEKLVCRLIPDSPIPEKAKELDERLLASPVLALTQCGQVLDKMAVTAMQALRSAMSCVLRFDERAAAEIRAGEEETDRLEEEISSYLLQLTSRQISEEESLKAAGYMKIIGDYERIADLAVNVLESAEEMRDKDIVFSERARGEYRQISSAADEILSLSYQALSAADISAARRTGQLKQSISKMKEDLRTRHVLRLQKGECGVIAGFIWIDLLTGMERISDHCASISGCVPDIAGSRTNAHRSQRVSRYIDPEKHDAV